MPNLGIVVPVMFFGIIAYGMIGSVGPTTEYTAYNVYFPHVSDQMDDDDYLVLDLDKRSKTFGQQKKWHFCKDLDGKSVPFDEGETLLDLTYRNHWDCMKAISWHFERDALNKYYETRR